MELERRTILFEEGQPFVLVIQRQQVLAILIGLLAIYYKVIVEHPAFLQMLSHNTRLLARWIESVFECFTRTINSYVKPIVVNKKVGFRGRYAPVKPAMLSIRSLKEAAFRILFGKRM